MRANSLELRRRGHISHQEFSPRTPAPLPANRAASPVASSETLHRLVLSEKSAGEIGQSFGYLISYHRSNQ